MGCVVEDAMLAVDARDFVLRPLDRESEALERGRLFPAAIFDELSWGVKCAAAGICR